MSTPFSDSEDQLADYLFDLQRYYMPFGRYGPDNFPPAGKPIYDLPLEYLIWFERQDHGFPKGRLGELMRFVWEVKSVGAEQIFAAVRKGDLFDTSQDE